MWYNYVTYFFLFNKDKSMKYFHFVPVFSSDSLVSFTELPESSLASLDVD